MKMIGLSFRLKGGTVQALIIYKIPRRFPSRSETSLISSEAHINQKGFTLLEIILAITAMAIIAVVAGVGLVEMTKGYIFSKKNAFITQQGQIAVARVKKELSNIKSVTGMPTATSIIFVRSSDSSTHFISWSGGSSPLLLDDITLITPVTSFSLNYYDFYTSTNSQYLPTTSMIEMRLQLKGAENTVINFTDRVNLYLETGGS